MLAAIYARYATDMQSKASIENQVHVCGMCCQTNANQSQ
jgi:hypothetical protein